MRIMLIVVAVTLVAGPRIRPDHRPHRPVCHDGAPT